MAWYVSYTTQGQRIGPVRMNPALTPDAYRLLVQGAGFTNLSFQSRPDSGPSVITPPIGPIQAITPSVSEPSYLILAGGLFLLWWLLRR